MQVINTITTSTSQTDEVLHLIKSMQDAMLGRQGAMKKMELNYELPYNEWLFRLVREKLCVLGFAVFCRDKSCPKAPV